MNRTATPRAGQPKKIIYYRGDINEELSGITKNTITIGERFPYLHKNPLWNIAAAVVYRLIMTPFAFVYSKLKFSYRIIGKKRLKEVKKTGAFLYGNHTMMAGDAFLPSMVTFPKRAYVVVNADNLSTPGTKNWVQMSGALPIPTEFSGMRHFLNAMEKRILQEHCIMIYPEAHIWPYYPDIRPYGSGSFRYPVKYDAPAFAVTTTFSQKKHGKTPKVTLYVDGPFYPDKTLPPREREKALHAAVYSAMCERAKNTTYSPYEYVKLGQTEETP